MEVFSHLSWSILEIERVSNIHLVFAFGNVLSCGRIMSEGAEIVISQNHNMTYEPAVKL